MKRGVVILVLTALLGAAVVRGLAADPDTAWREAVRTVVTTNGLVLASGKVLVGQPNGAAAAKTLSGDASIATNGVLTAAGQTTNVVLRVVQGSATNSVTFQFTNGMLRGVQ